MATSRTALNLSPSADYVNTLLGTALLEMGEFEEALARAELELNPIFRNSLLAMANYALGRQAEFESAFQKLREEWGESLPMYVAMLYAYTGDEDSVFEWLDRVTPEQPLVTWLTFWPAFASLHGDPRWTAYRERMGQSEEQVAAIAFEVRLPPTRK